MIPRTAKPKRPQGCALCGTTEGKMLYITAQAREYAPGGAVGPSITSKSRVVCEPCGTSWWGFIEAAYADLLKPGGRG